MLTKDDLLQIGEVMDTKIGEVLEAVNKGFSGVQEDIQGLKTDVRSLTQHVTKIEATMVTKSYLDDKLADLRGEFVLKRRGLA